MTDQLPKHATHLQRRVAEWSKACFGQAITADTLERTDRFLEEALELAQTLPEFTADRAHALVDYVFGRPVGDAAQEVGGVMLTLAALCNARGIAVAAEANRELDRVWGKIEEIRAKQAAKPVGSALPIAVSPPTLEGLTPHKGGACPYNAGDLVEVMARDDLRYLCQANRVPGWIWRQEPRGDDIVASRLVAPYHKLQGFGPVVQGPPPSDAVVGTFAVLTSNGGWYEPETRSHHWQDVAAHAIRVKADV